MGLTCHIVSEAHQKSDLTDFTVLNIGTGKDTVVLWIKCQKFGVCLIITASDALMCFFRQNR